MPRFAKIVTLSELYVYLPFSPPFLNYMRHSAVLEHTSRKKLSIPIMIQHIKWLPLEGTTQVALSCLFEAIHLELSPQATDEVEKRYAAACGR